MKLEIQAQVRIPATSLSHVQHLVPHVGDDVPLIIEADAESFTHRVWGGQDHLDPALAPVTRLNIFLQRVLILGKTLSPLVQDL